MANIPNYFTTRAHDLLSQLSEEILHEFAEIDNDKERIKFMYKYAIRDKIEFVSDSKDFKLAGECKTRANEQYKKRQFEEAINNYTDGLMVCPFEKTEERELYTIIAANRSAAYFENKNYDRVLLDIDHVISIGGYPKQLMYKLWIRKAKVMTYMGKSLRDVLYCYCKAEESLGDTELSVEAKDQVVADIRSGARHAEENLETLISPTIGSVTNTHLDDFFPSEDYLSLSEKVTIKEDKYQGRYIEAITDIEAGEMVAIEKAHCSVLNIESSRTHCDFCKEVCKIIVPCINCKAVIYCSIFCRFQSIMYHQYECDILATFYRYELSINCHLVLRTITDKTEKFFCDRKEKLNFDEKLVDTEEEQKMYDEICNLCTHDEARLPMEYMHYTLISIFLVRLLKNTHYFNYQTEDEVLTETECLVASAMLLHLQSYQYNAHEIAELKIIDPDIWRKELEVNALAESFYTHSVGGAVYPTLAMFNHSCDPNVVRYNKNDMLIIRAIRPIRANQIVYDNYGPIFTIHTRLQRQAVLFEKYKFQCRCDACEEDWKLFTELDDSQLRFRCYGCGQGCWVRKTIKLPRYICPNPRCKKVNVILKKLYDLTGAATICENAEALYEKGKYEDALTEYGKAMKLYTDYLLPPCTDMIKMQQRMRNCVVHFGSVNKYY